MPIAVILSGILIGQTIKLPAQDGQYFGINIPKVIKVAARNGEVVFGLCLFLIILMASGIMAGPAVYQLIVRDFGIDPGQFDGLCVFSSLASVVVSAFIFLITKGLGLLSRKTDPKSREYDDAIEKVASERPLDRPEENNV